MINGSRYVNCCLYLAAAWVAIQHELSKQRDFVMIVSQYAKEKEKNLIALRSSRKFGPQPTNAAEAG